MALIIEPKGEKKIEIPGLDIELPSLYVRLETANRADGKTVEIAFISCKNKEKFIEGKQCITSVPTGNIKIELESTETQSIITAHIAAKNYFEQLGYTVTYSDITIE